MPSKLGFHGLPEGYERLANLCAIIKIQHNNSLARWAVDNGIKTVIVRNYMELTGGNPPGDKATDDFTRWGGLVNPEDAAERWWAEYQQKYPGTPSGAYIEAWNEFSDWDLNAQEMFTRAEIRRIRIMARDGYRAAIGCPATGCPPLPDDPDPGKRGILAAWFPMFEAALEHGAIYSRHAYGGPWLWWLSGSWQWDHAADTWTMYGASPPAGGYLFDRWLLERYWLRRLSGGNDFDRLPIALSEFGIDHVAYSDRIVGTPIGGWQSLPLRNWWRDVPQPGDPWHTDRGTWQEQPDYEAYFMLQMRWADGVMRSDPYCLGATLFGSEGWDTHGWTPRLVDTMIDHMRALQHVPNPEPETPPPEPEPPPESPPPEPEPNGEENGVDANKVLNAVKEILLALGVLLALLGVNFIDLNAQIITTPTPVVTTTPAPTSTAVPQPTTEPTATPLPTDTLQPTATPPPQGATLLNPGFEGGWWTKQYVEVSVPDGWDLRYLEGDSFCWNGWCARRPECKVIPNRAPYLDPPRVYEGEQAYQTFTMWGQGDGALVQTVNVPADMWVRFSIWVHSWSSQADDPFVSDIIDVAPSNVKFWIGIHPDKNADPYCEPAWDAYACGWSWKGPYWCPDEWCQLKIKKQGAGTVAVRWRTEYPFKHNDIHLDGAALEEAGG